MEITGQSYGANQETNAAQSAAPLAAPSQPQPAAPAMAPPTPLTAPSSNPGEPVTAGADHGPGPTSADIGLRQDSNAEIRAKLGHMMPVLMRIADAPYATSAYRREVRQLIARINS